MKLLEKKSFGSIDIKNSLVMAAMTRSRAGIDGIPNEMMIEYYKQRSSAGLIITEATSISEDGIGSPYTPGIFTKDQIEGWKKVTNAVHENGGKIVVQLWHTGRIAHSIDRKGVLPVAPSPIAIKQSKHFTSQGLQDYETPKELSLEEIEQIKLDYKQAALNAIDAGFDGVQLHAANGYLPLQFLADSSNTRTDTYGGSIENKSRFILEVLEVLIEAIGADKVGIKLSPLQPYGEIIFNDPVATYSYLIAEINKLNIAFVEYMKRNYHQIETPNYPKGDEIDLLANKIQLPIIANSGYTKESAEIELKKGIATAVSFGIPFIANPDLPYRLEKNLELNAPNPQTFFGGNEIGYIDYPFHS